MIMDASLFFPTDVETSLGGVSPLTQILRQQMRQLLQGYAIQDCLFWESSPDTRRGISLIEQELSSPALLAFSQAILARQDFNFFQCPSRILGASTPEDYDWGDETQLTGSSHAFLLLPCYYGQHNLGGIGLAKPTDLTAWSLQDLTGLKAIAAQYAFQVYHWQKMLQTQEDLTRQLQTLTLKLEEMIKVEQEKNETFSHIHHELRTPLTGILGFSRMLKDELYGPLNDKQKQYIQGIYNSGEHLLSLVNDFLDIAKLEACREELFLEMVAVEDICLASFSMVQSRAKEQGLALKLELGEGVGICMADQKRLKQILINLLSNAIKFTEEGSVTLRVEGDRQELRFSVIDTGIGISPHHQTQLFQPFSQIPNPLSRKHKGTGLGLALSKKLAQLHGGDITLRSQVGQGSCFTLHLPL